MHFGNNGASTGSPNTTQVHFGRVIYPDSGGKVISAYQVNGRNVTREAYIKNFKAFNILVDARNFLVFQVC